MNAHPIMTQAVAPFAPPRKADNTDTLRRTIDILRADWNSLLRLPFEVEVMVRDAGHNGPAEYTTVYANENDVRDAVDALIDKHIVELEADVKRRMAVRSEGDF